MAYYPGNNFENGAPNYRSNPCKQVASHSDSKCAENCDPNCISTYIPGCTPGCGPIPPPFCPPPLPTPQLASAGTVRSTFFGGLILPELIFPIAVTTAGPFNPTTTVIDGGPALFNTPGPQIGFIQANAVGTVYDGLFYTLEQPGTFQVSATINIGVSGVPVPDAVAGQILFIPYDTGVPQIVTGLQAVESTDGNLVFVITPVTFNATVRGRFSIRFVGIYTAPPIVAPTGVLAASSVFTVELVN